MLEPGLKVASAGLNHRTRVETIRRQFRERNLVEVVEGGKAMFARRPDIDMRAANVAVLEEENTRNVASSISRRVREMVT